MINIFDNMTRAIKRFDQYNRTVRELSALSDRQLVDLNMTRFDIKSVARDHVRAL